MGLIRINRNPSRRELNQFGFIWLGFFSLFGAIAWLRFDRLDVAASLWLAAVAIPAAGWMVPAVMRLVYIALAVIAFPIGFVVSHLVLAAVYYLVLTPIGLVMRGVGYDPMARRFDPEAASYWVTRPPAPEAGRYFRQF